MKFKIRHILKDKNNVFILDLKDVEWYGLRDNGHTIVAREIYTGEKDSEGNEIYRPFELE